MMRSKYLSLTLVSTSLALAACNAGPLLKTGSLAAKPTEAAAPPPAATSTDRALHVAATSVRAQKCGYYFDPAALRQNFLAAEAARGEAPDVLAKTTQAYDFTAKSISAKIVDTESYCNKTRTAVIKSSLQNALAGNFEPPPKKQVADSDGGLLGIFGEADETKEAWNRDHIYDSALNKDPYKKIEKE